MMRIATIRVRSDTDQALQAMRKQFIAAWKTGEYQGEVFEFESPAALFRLLTPKRWELLEGLQDGGPCGVRELARLLGRDVRRVHDDISALLDAGLVEKTEDGKLIVPFGEIHADFVLRGRAA
jgi:predicted transcriptional regulator